MNEDFTFSKAAWERNKARLIKQTFKLLPMFEQGEDWRKQQQTLVLEIKGYSKIFHNCPSLLVLAAKLSAIDEAEEQELFRKTVFEAISLIKELEDELIKFK